MEGVREINRGRYEHVSFYTCMPFSRIKKIYKKIRRLKGEAVCNPGEPL